MSASELGSRACVRTLHFCFLSCTNFTELYKYSILHCNIYQYIHIWSYLGIVFAFQDAWPAQHIGQAGQSEHRIYFRSFQQHMDSALPALHSSHGVLHRFQWPVTGSCKTMLGHSLHTSLERSGFSMFEAEKNKQQGRRGNSQGTWKEPG